MANITAWVKKVWKDRKTEYPTRRTLTKTNGSQEIVTVARNEGNVSQEGDAFSAANMNDLEERIDAGFTELNGKLTSLNRIGLSKDVSIAAHTGKTLTFTFNDTGYKKILAICGIDISNGNVVISSFVITGDNTARVDVLNTYDSTLTVAISTYVLMSNI